MFRKSDLKADCPGAGTPGCTSARLMLGLAQVWIAAKRWAHAGVEPSLDELLSDPIIRLLMSRDGWPEERLRRLIRTRKIS